MNQACGVKECFRPIRSRGYCSAHYLRWLHGQEIDVVLRESQVNKVCQVEWCRRPAEIKRLCDGHYQRKRLGIEMDRPFPTPRAGKCRALECQKQDMARGLCSMHYRRWQKFGDHDELVLKHIAREIIRYCRVDGCERPHVAKGLCKLHYERFERTGNVGPAGLLRNGANGTITADGYRTYKVGKIAVLEHRSVMERILGRPLKPFENVHHLNGRRSDNHPENLELWTKPQPPGQRVEDLIAWMVAHYRTEVEVALKEGETSGD